MRRPTTLPGRICSIALAIVLAFTALYISGLSSPPTYAADEDGFKPNPYTDSDDEFILSFALFGLGSIYGVTADSVDETRANLRAEFYEGNIDGGSVPSSDIDVSAGYKSYKLPTPTGDAPIYLRLYAETKGGEVFAGDGYIDKDSLARVMGVGYLSTHFKAYKLVYGSEKGVACGDEDWTVVLKDSKGRTASPGAIGGGKAFLIRTNESYFFESESLVESYVGKTGYLPGASSYAVMPGAFLATEREVTFNIPEGAKLTVFRMERIYGWVEEIDPLRVDEGNPVYMLKDSPYLVYAEKEGHTSTLTNIFPYDGRSAVDIALAPTLAQPIDYAREYAGQFQDFFEDGLLMNAPDSGEIRLSKPGDTFTLKTFRASQILNSSTESGEMPPMYRYEVVSGDAVAAQETRGNRCLLTAVKPGTSLVRVSYDPIYVTTYGKAFNGIDPVHTGLVVVRVGETGLDTGVGLGEFDTVYINDGLYLPGKGAPEDGTKQDTASYTFTPPEGATVSVLSSPADPLSAIEDDDFWGFAEEGNWQPATTEGGAATVALSEGKNLIRVTQGGKTGYHVVRAMKTKVYVENLTQDGEPPVIGDEVRVRFDNINNPIPKISKVYNPGYNFGTIFKDGRGTVRILYDMNGEEVSSGGTQYGLHIDSSLDIIPDDIGSYNFEGGRIVSTVMSYFGFPAHRSLADAGYGSGLLGTAGEYGPYFHSVLPSFSFDVGLNDAEDEAIGGDTGRLDFTRLAGLTLPASPQVAGYNVSSPFNISFPDEHSYHQYAAFARGVSGLPVRVDGINFREEQSASDYDIYWRYWKEGGEKSVATLQASMPAQSVPWTSGSLTIPNANSTDILYGEVIVSPKNGDAENTAYSILFGAGTNGSTGGGLYPFFRDLEIAPADHAKDYIQTDGLLKVADTARIEGDETLGLGYGYLFSERDYAMTVPGAAEAIDIQPYPFFNSVLGSENIGRIDVYVDEEPFKTVYPTDIDPQSESAAISMEDFAPIEDIRLNASGETKIELRLAFNEKVQTEYTKAFFYKNADWYKANPETDKPEGVVYTITVNRPDAGADALLNVPAGVTATFRDSITGNALSPKEEGGNAYSLRAGDYALDLSGTRYYKKSLSVSVTEDGGEYAMKVVDGDKEYPITPGEGGAFTIDALSYLAVAPDASGKQVGVRVVGYDGTVRDTVITVPAETPDLTSYINEYNKEGKLKYVRANAGGYTALHSVIDALLPGDGWDGLRFSCVNGKLTPGVVFSKTNHGADWGWLCRVDGKLVNPAETALEGGETVVFHYNAALAGQQYASIEDAPTSLPRNRDLSFKLLGTDVASNDEAAPVEDAEIYIDGALWDDVSSEDGVYTLTGLRDLPIGDHTIVAKKVDGNGVNTLTYAAAEIDLLASVVESDEPDAWSVSEAKDRIGAVFDANLNAIYSKANYETLKALRDGGFAAVEGAGMPAAIKTMAEYTITAINEQAARMQPSVLVGASLADPDGTVRLSFEDRVKRPSSGYITEPNPLGDIISSLDVPYKEGDTMEDVTVRALTALGLASEMDGNAEYQSAYLSSIGEFYLPGGKYVQTLAEFSNGEGSGWMITLNGWFIDRGISSFTVADGDSVRWQYTCNLGADLGSEAATGGANAEIMGLSFGTSGTLYPAYSSDVTSYTYTVPAGTEGVKVAARLSSHNSTATYEAGGLAYNEGATIPVKDGAEITITSNYSDGNKTDRRVVTITVRVEGEGGALPEPTDPPDTSADGALYAALGYLGAGVTNPIMDSVGGEWAVVALARAGVGDPDAQVYQNYLKNLETAASAKIASTDPDTQVNKVVFRDRRITDNERVVVALSALGKDASAYTASDGKTYDFLSAILDRQAAPNDGEYQAVVQGINGAIFALLALDSGGYLLPEDEPAGTVPLSADESGTVGVLDADDPASAEALESGDPASVEPLEGNDTPTVGPGTAARAYYLNFVLGREKNTGGWALGGEKDAAGDPDITGMTLQALARYYKMDDAAYAPYADAGAPALADIKAAVGRALTMLKDAQNEETGGFNHGGETSESAAQVLTGLSALGTDGTEDGSLFASVLANLLTYRNEATGAFVHVKGSDKGAQMATEQATYALVAYTRYVAGLAPLYDMSDVRVDPDTGAASFGWAFDYVPPISLTAINNAIAKARGLTEASYTAQTWANLQEALRKAQTAAAKEDATQDEIDAAARALNAAISALKAKETPLGPGGGEETPLPYDDNTLADGTVNVHADAGVIPSGALITADRQGISTALADAIKKQFGKDSLVYAVLDINLLQNGAKVLPNGLVEIRVAIDPAWDRTGLAVLRAEDDGSFTNMNARIENDFLVFTTDHFSNYIVAKLANPQGVATVTSAANAAQTGDDTQPELWLALGLIALLLLAAGVIGYRRLRQKGQKDDGSVLS